MRYKSVVRCPYLLDDVGAELLHREMAHPTEQLSSQSVDRVLVCEVEHVLYNVVAECVLVGCVSSC